MLVPPSQMLSPVWQMVRILEVGMEPKVAKPTAPKVPNTLLRLLLVLVSTFLR